VYDVEKFLEVDRVDWEIPCGPRQVYVGGRHGGSHVGQWPCLVYCRRQMTTFPRG